MLKITTPMRVEALLLSTLFFACSGSDGESLGGEAPMSASQRDQGVITDQGVRSADQGVVEGPRVIEPPPAEGPLPTPRPTERTRPTSIDAPFSGGELNEAACSARRIAEVRGWILDEVGEPVSGAKAYFCIRFNEGELACLRSEETDAEGVFTVTVPLESQCVDRAALRAQVPNGGFASIYCDLSEDLVELPESDDPVLRLNEPFILYQTRPFTGLTLEAEGDDTRAEVSFGELSLSLISEQLFIADPEELRARQVPTDAPGLCFLDEPAEIAALYAFSPEVDLFGGRAGLRLPNESGAAPGESLKLFALGSLDCSLNADEKLEEGHWEEIGTARVDESGEWIEAEATSGLPCLSWFGLSSADTP
ncbi:MAG: hypothetical protein VYD19_09240 [Myxococcota bacterium]|nr:hypothetical protein [Myxococcota bacterium]